MLEGADYFESERTQIAQFTREKQSGIVQQYSSPVQTSGVLKRSSGHKQYYSPKIKTRHDKLLREFSRDTPP